MKQTKTTPIWRFVMFAISLSILAATAVDPILPFGSILKVIIGVVCFNICYVIYLVEVTHEN